MYLSLKIPPEVPEPGFYYHYKYDPSIHPRDQYAYEFIGVGAHTEEDNVFFANYRPLYETAQVYQAAKALGVPCNDLRPLAMWMGDVEVGGVTKKRFTKITDPQIITELKKIRANMYP